MLEMLLPSLRKCSADWSRAQVPEEAIYRSRVSVQTQLVDGLR